MSKEITRVNFDYDQLSKDEKGKLLNLEGRIQRKIAAAAKSIMDLGEDLAAAQEVLGNHGNGVFGDWVDHTFPMSRRTAYKQIAAWQKFKDCAHYAQIEPSALYALAENEAPKLALNAALKLAEKGGIVTHKVAQELIAKYAQPKPPQCAAEPRTFPDPGPDDDATQDADGTQQIPTNHPPNTHDAPQDEPQEDSEAPADMENRTEPGEGVSLADTIPEPTEPEPAAFDRDNLIESHNKEIESFCRSLTKFYDENCPKNFWTDFRGVRNCAKQHISATNDSIRNCKCIPCPACDEGCKWCQHRSMLPRMMADTIPNEDRKEKHQ